MVFLRNECVCFWTVIRIKLQDFITNTDTENKAMSEKKKKKEEKKIRDRLVVKTSGFFENTEVKKISKWHKMSRKKLL